MRTAVALGSNLGDRLANLRAAREAIVDLPGVEQPILSSAVYETDAVNCEPGAGKFLNAVIEFDYSGDPFALLKKLREIENALGRPSNHPRNVSRQIDIDLLYAGDVRVDSEELRLPHPRMQDRKFVLQPLADIAPDFVFPGQTQSARELLGGIKEQSGVARFRSEW